MKIRHYLALLGALFLATLSQVSHAGTIEAVNHTKWAINHFSVDGQSGIDIIGPYQGGGGGCCYSVPPKWQPGMKVRVDWETGVAFASDVPQFPAPKEPDTTGMNEKEYYQAWGDYSEKRRAWRKKIKSLSKEHYRLVEVPDYTGQETCGITVHFLPCDEVKVTTSCLTYNNPNHPIKEPIKMAEPKICPK